MRYFMFLCMLMSFTTKGQEMTSGRLGELFEEVADTVVPNGNSFQILYKERPIFCIYDENANRMRIISPIVKREELEEEQLLNAMVANFHSALDVKYALSDEVIWSVFTHPLAELSDGQVLDAIDQVFLAAATFGTSYSSTTLVFPGNTKKKEDEHTKKLIERSKN
ncbi:hypothetical protein [Maribacter sp. 2210JD10-5]|uniref:hypothetical protein n=1 Tax=Maribacter sp. 2210JD10-5 TaxID=3386272 RepID=UPI0039BD4F44